MGSFNLEKTDFNFKCDVVKEILIWGHWFVMTEATFCEICGKNGNEKKR
jgi:hypothetical protein